MRHGLRLMILLLALCVSALAAAPAFAQLPAFVPAARYYGTVFVFGVPVGAGTVSVQSAAGTSCGVGSIVVGQYNVDIQAYAGCGTPLAFFVNGQPADQSSIVPNNLSGAVMLNLTVSNPCGYLYNQPVFPYNSPAYPCSQPVPVPAPPLPLPPLSGPPAPPFAQQPATLPPPPPFAAQATVTYQPGWNLISGPTGALPGGIAGPLFTFQPGDTSYESLPGNAPLQAGYGYWALINSTLTATISGTGSASITRVIPNGQFAMIGNPFARAATVSGGGAIYVYIPGSGYQQTTTLQAGQGAWVQGGPTGQVIIQST